MIKTLILCYIVLFKYHDTTRIRGKTVKNHDPWQKIANNQPIDAYLKLLLDIVSQK